MNPRLYAWMVHEPDSGWNIIGAEIPLLGHIPLVTSIEANARSSLFERVAQMHRQRTGLPVALVVFHYHSLMENLP